MRRVVVTGLGAVTPIGNNVRKMWESIENSKCGIAPITNYDTATRKVTLAGEVKNFNPLDKLDKAEARRMDRFTQFAIVASMEALEDSGIDTSVEDMERCGVMVSSAIGGLSTIEQECNRGNAKGFDRVSPHYIPMSIINMAAGNIAIKLGFHGMCSCVVTACAASTNAIGDAFRQIRDGYQDVIVAGGTEASISSFGIGGFTAMKALSTSTDPNRASIPFDKERSGFVMGEGAGILVLEEYEHAIKRNAHIYCEMVGYGSTCDAFHVTAPDPEGKYAAACMKQAISDAGIKPGDINYINAHGTSTYLNDVSETKAIKLAFSDCYDKLMVSSTKSMTGHLLGASGGVEAIITALSVYKDLVPATINYKVPDEECDLDVVPNEARRVTVNYAMSNSLGFGGHNASIIMKKYK